MGVSKEREVRVFAEDSNDADNKALAKLNKRNSEWVTTSVYREDGQGDDDWVAQ